MKSLAEISFRLRQMIWNSMDHIGCGKYSRSLLDGSFLEERSRTFNFFFNSKDLEKIVEKFKEEFPDACERVVGEADLICKHHFDLLGYKNLYWGDGDNVNWHLDPVNQKESPKIWWRKIDCSDAQVVGDPKVIWELNRHQHFLTLAKAYLLSGDEKYRNEFISQLESWFLSNPPKIGINWASSLELAYRSIAWIWAYHLFDCGRNLPRGLLNQLVTYLFIQAGHIEQNLSTYFSPNTHLTGEALGLFYIGLFFEGNYDSERWVKTGRDILLREIEKHVMPDGGYMEQSFWYHRYTLDIYLHFYLLANLNKIDLPANVRENIERLAEFLMYSIRPDRTFPLIGDDDGGRLLPLDALKGNDLRGLFSTLSIIFRRGDFKFVSEAYQEESLFLAGSKSKEIYDGIEMHEPASYSKGFKETGYFFMRSNWSESANYLAFDCGPHGWMNGGHAHADLLSFEIHSGRQPIIVDPGTYVYINEDGWRDFFRGSKSHATLSLDGEAPAVPSNSFHWKKIPSHKLHQFYTSFNHDYVAGSVYADGFEEIVREVHFIKPDYFLIIDTLRGEGKKQLEVRFPLAVGKWSLLSAGCWQGNKENRSGIVFLGCTGFRASLEPSWISPVYGKKEISNTLVLTGALVLPYREAYLIDLSGKGPLDKPDFVLKRNTFRLSIGEDSWIGFGSVESKESIHDEEIETDFKAGLIKCLPSGEIEVLAVYEGSYLSYQGRQIKVSLK